MPRPDPRGNTFNQRIPQIPYGSMGPFQAGEIPTQALMESRGIALNPDRLAYHPDDIMNNYWLHQLMQLKI